MATDPCPRCGANRVMVGMVHRCVPRELPRVESPPLVTKPPATKGVVTKPDTMVRSAPRHRPYPLRRPPTTLCGGRAWLGADLVVGPLKQNIAAKQA